jgi:anti-sigma factor RsiW
VTIQQGADAVHVPLSAPESEAVEERAAVPAPRRKARAGFPWPVTLLLRLLVPAGILAGWYAAS